MSLLGATVNGNVETVITLLRAGADVDMADEEGRPVVHKARRGNLEIMGFPVVHKPARDY
ncbi:hypothetical protein BDV38DRAFT_262162 [Aspergillus pseudotamarii]|uniref:Ankyrin repeat-containing domain protein n=1 Tax=Aspergillus pseudotamarii TaxID=132259 RepID=A0A5N6SBM1_ASPPS|nr:uncharacterized protein BDV38DRAFT_262162 [Aspergillus pseudotamarii]KAE8132106.1 hypothetical protein BDV38DRAFT_262162 [Aspergillus pseudotamarii]